MREEIERVIFYTKTIAHELGAGWNIKPQDEPYPSQVICGPDGAELHVRIEWNHKDRIAIGGSLNIGKNRQYVEVRENGVRQLVPDITVALKRGAVEIVKEIRRRLLPEYLRMLALGQKQEADRNDYEARRRAPARTLCRHREVSDQRRVGVVQLLRRRARLRRRVGERRRLCEPET